MGNQTNYDDKGQPPWSSRARPSFLALVLLFIFVVSAIGTSHATPMPGPRKKGMLHWAKDTTIKLWVPPDPDNVPGRRDALIDGIKSWLDQQPLKGLNIKIEVATEDPGNNITNVIKVGWSEAGSLVPEQGEGLPSGNENNLITFARIQIDRSISKDFAYNLGQHEMGHALGLKDSKTPGEVMYGAGIQATGQATFTSGDLAELKAAYTASLDQTDVEILAEVFRLGPDYVYRYTANWLGGGNLAVFQVDTHGAPVFGIVAPIDWMVDDFSFLPHATPTFTGIRDEIFVAFIHQADDAYLDADHPVLSFEFRSSTPPVPAEAFLNGLFQTQGPSAVPEPSSLSLVSTGFVFFLAWAWYRRRSAGGGPRRRRRPRTDEGNRGCIRITNQLLPCWPSPRLTRGVGRHV